MKFKYNPILSKKKMIYVILLSKMIVINTYNCD